jgi:hypothetical protein
VRQHHPLGRVALIAFAGLSALAPIGVASVAAATSTTTPTSTTPGAGTTTPTSTTPAAGGTPASSNATASTTRPSSVPAYWLASSDGGVYSFGGATFYGSAGNIALTKPIVGMAATTDDNGYWLVASDGGIFSYGDAVFYGSTGGIKLNKPIVGMAPTPDGKGYWLVASDGGIFSFGDAQFYGSTGGIVLNQPIIGMMAGPSGTGYVLVAADGGTFTYGSAPFYGSLGGIPLKNPIAAAAITPGDTGYWFSDSTGVVSAFGQASYYGSAPLGIGASIVGMAKATGTGAFVGAAYTSGSYGFDVSKFNMNSPACTSGLPTGVHDISVVEVDGESSGAANPCLTTEGTWAGAGLNLYTFLTNSGLCTTSSTCFTVGYNAGIQAFQDAQAAGVNTNVGWWLDVEGAGQYWTSSTANNAETVMGAIAALHETEGVADVGIYASPGTWNGIVGDYQPSVPYWMADWLSPASGPGTCAAIAGWQAEEQLPTGPVNFVQYSDNVNGADGDYAC